MKISVIIGLFSAFSCSPVIQPGELVETGEGLAKLLSKTETETAKSAQKQTLPKQLNSLSHLDLPEPVLLKRKKRKKLLPATKKQIATVFGFSAFSSMFLAVAGDEWNAQTRNKTRIMS